VSSYTGALREPGLSLGRRMGCRASFDGYSASAGSQMHISPEKSEVTGHSATPAAIRPMSCLIRRPVTSHATVLGAGGSSGKDDGRSWERVHRALCREVQSLVACWATLARSTCHRRGCQSQQCEQCVAADCKHGVLDPHDFLSPELDISFLEARYISFLELFLVAARWRRVQASAPLLSRGFLVEFSVGLAYESR
jgi:hypothetical protein